MANSLSTVALKYTDILDEIVTAETLTSDLNMNPELIGEFKQGGKVEIPKLSLDGLGDYSRTNGFPAGDITFAWEEKQLSYDRGREFVIDDMDDAERLQVVSINAMSEFVRTKVVPEIDAVRFDRLATAAGTKVSKTFSGDTAVADAQAAVLAAEAAMEDAGAPLSECIIYCTAAFKNLLRQGAPYRFGVGEGPNTNFVTYDDMKVVTVPQNRFYAGLTMYDGTTSGQEDGGYIKNASTGKDLNFIVVHPSACAAIQKHEKLRYFSPDVYQDADAHDFQYRVYHDLITLDNKAALIYASKKA